MTRFFIYLCFLSLLWVSCRDDDMTFEIGGNDLDVKTRMAFVDTFTVKSYTVMLDSIATSSLSSPSVVVGRYVDPLVGTITAGSFFRLLLDVPVNSNYNIDRTAVFDSLKLYMVYDGYYEGDTTLPFTINVFRLDQEMKSNTDGYFYNNDSTPCKPDLFGKATFQPHPHSKDSIYITLDTTFGKELFSLMKVNNEQLTESEKWLNYFKGLMIRYDESNNAILGFNFPLSTLDTTKIAMRIYYHYFDDYSKVSKKYEFKAQPAMQYNRFSLSNSMINFPLNQTISLPASATNNLTYIYAGIGLVTRIEIPYLKNLFYIDDDIRILDAELEIEPSSYTYDEFNLPRKMSLITTDNYNRWGSLVYNKFNNEQTGNLVIDELYQEDTRYTFDITPYLSTRLELETDMIPAMLLTVSAEDFYKRTRRVIIGSQKNIQNKMKLRVYYMNINEQ